MWRQAHREMKHIYKAAVSATRPRSAPRTSPARHQPCKPTLPPRTCFPLHQLHTNLLVWRAWVHAPNTLDHLHNRTSTLHHCTS